MPKVKPFSNCTEPAVIGVDATFAATKANDTVVAVTAVIVRTPSHNGSIPLTTIFAPTVIP